MRLVLVPKIAVVKEDTAVAEEDKVVAEEAADEEGGLRIIDISNPLNPILIAGYDTSGDPGGIFSIDTLAFIADYDNLQILRSPDLEKTKTAMKSLRVSIS